MRTVVGVAFAVLGVLACGGAAAAGVQDGTGSEVNSLRLIHDGAAFYPRAVELGDGAVLVTFDHPVAGGRAIACLRSTDGGKTWGDYRLIAQDVGRVDVANAFPVQLADGTILVACRHHKLEDRRFGIELYASNDSGRSWQPRGTIASGSTGLWEPFLFEPSSGVLQAYYASEEDIYPDQRVEMRTSGDDGRTWSEAVTVAAKKGSRDGMPAVVRTRSGDLLACFEASDTAPFGFVIRAVRSSDDGASWSPERELVYEPVNPVRARWSAGAPYLAVLPDGRLVTSFQTDEDVAYRRGDAGRDPGLPEYRYTRHTSLKAVISSGGDGRSWSSAVRLSGSPEDPATWGGLYVLRNGRVLELTGIGGRIWWKYIEP